jgi:hypothetical protein
MRGLELNQLHWIQGFQILITGARHQCLFINQRVTVHVAPQKQNATPSAMQ